uniref:Non-structural maintenance of chromosomes element 4 n=1 Tax=Elaeophora elaphi TaxID=1147741 RepID=A0A0R3RFV9_9BILA
MDEELETLEDVGQCGTSNDEENELLYHERAQQLCEKLDKLTTEVSEGDERDDDLRSQRYLQQTSDFEENFAKTQSCRYMMTDAKLTKSLSKLVATEVQSFHNSSAKKTITLHSFVQTLTTFLENNCGLIEEDGKITPENQQSSWAAFGSHFIDVLNLPPALSCLGPLLLEEIPKGINDEIKKLDNSVKKKVERTKLKGNGEIMQLQEVEEEELQRRTDPLAKQLDNVMHCLKSYLKQHNTKSINYFEFCFHPTDFSRSVANAFYTSFLLKENKVGLDIGGDNMPRLSLIGNIERKALEDNADQDNRGIISFSYNDWQEIVKLLDIRWPVISEQ